MNLFVKSGPARIGISATCIVLAGLYIYTVLRIWRADWLQDQRNQQSLEASARLEPWDAQTHWLLGRYHFNGAQDQTRALTNFQRAVKLDPYEGRYWLDLAAAYEVANDPNASGAALERALRAEPTSPLIGWESANFFLAQNDTARALPLFRTAIQYGTRERIQAAIGLCWRATRSVTQVVDQALPPQPDAYFTFLEILTTQNETEPANELWRALTAQKLNFSVEKAFPYFDYLIRSQQIDQAEEVWRSLGQIDSKLLSETQSNLISNGGFESEYLNGGFGWRDQPHSQVDVSLDTSQFHRGTRALRFAFMGPQLSDIGVYQYISVRPNVTYHLSAFAKSEDIVSASGPRLVVEDFYNHQLLISTDDLLGTSGWREWSADFVSGPQTRLLTLKVTRIPGNALIKGKFWLDDIHLSAVSTAENNR
jgi:tetratricopeptide (TPR) repeat protein